MLSNNELLAASAILCRMWKYPDQYARLILDTLRLVQREMSDPSYLAAALKEAERLGLRAEEN